MVSRLNAVARECLLACCTITICTTDTTAVRRHRAESRRSDDVISEHSSCALCGGNGDGGPRWTLLHVGRVARAYFAHSGRGAPNAAPTSVDLKVPAQSELYSRAEYIKYWYIRIHTRYYVSDVGCVRSESRASTVNDGDFITYTHTHTRERKESHV